MRVVSARLLSSILAVAVTGCAQPLVRFNLDAGTDSDAGTDAGTDAGQIDAGNCAACPMPVHAPARCIAGQCGRGPCEPGFFDFDPAIFGCETSCLGSSCTLGDGGAVTLTMPPLSETGMVSQTPSSGSSYGSAVQTSTGYSNFGTLGEPTPAGPEQTSSTYRNRGGFKTQLERP